MRTGFSVYADVPQSIDHVVAWNRPGWNIVLVMTITDAISQLEYLAARPRPSTGSAWSSPPTPFSVGRDREPGLDFVSGGRFRLGSTSGTAGHGDSRRPSVHPDLQEVVKSASSHGTLARSLPGPAPIRPTAPGPWNDLEPSLDSYQSTCGACPDHHHCLLERQSGVDGQDLRSWQQCSSAGEIGRCGKFPG